MLTLSQQLLLKKLSGALTDGMFLSGRPELAPLDLERDYPDVERLFALEEWPFLRGDLELSHAQPGAVAFVARKQGRFAGFFAAHAFGSVGYLDMMIVAPEHRRAGIARPLYFTTVHALERKGARSLVVHTTNDSARMIRLLGFSAGESFTLLRREATGSADDPDDPDVVPLGARDLPDIVRLDASVFGVRRPEWIAGLMRQAGFLGLRRRGQLLACACLRPRRGEALCVEASAQSPDDLERVAAAAVARHAGRRLECFVRTGGELHRQLERGGFRVPAFFEAIGPLVEWRRGATGEVGRSPRLQCLAWF